MSSKNALSYLVVAAMCLGVGLLPACGQSSDAGEPSPGPASSASVSVTLVHGSATATANLSALATTDYKGQKVVPLSAVWAAGALADPSTLGFDFEGADGFHPSAKPACKARITADQLSKGFLLPEGRTLVWDESLGLPNCYGVHDVAKIIGLDLAGTEG